MKSLETGGLAWAVGEAINVIKDLIGETMKILSLKYNPKEFGFEVECVMPGHAVPGIYRFGKEFFPNHAPVKLLDENVQVGEKVHVWIKEEELLKKEGWQELAKGIIASPDSPFKIGKGKKVYLGGAHKGTVCLDQNFKPFIAIKGYRFSPTELKLILKIDAMFLGKNAEIKSDHGLWSYNAESMRLVTPHGFSLKGDEIQPLLDLFRRAKLV